MTERVTVATHRIDHEEWEKTNLACPKCAHREVWRVAEKERGESLFRFVVGGQLHVCARCKQVSRLSMEEAGPRVKAMLRQLQALSEADDEESKRVFQEAMRKLGVVRGGEE